jgi:hypothetical protein
VIVLVGGLWGVERVVDVEIDVVWDIDLTHQKADHRKLPWSKFRLEGFKT